MKKFGVFNKLLQGKKDIVASVMLGSLTLIVYVAGTYIIHIVTAA